MEGSIGARGQHKLESWEGVYNLTTRPKQGLGGYGITSEFVNLTGLSLENVDPEIGAVHQGGHEGTARTIGSKSGY